ncbi:hypothetical protein [Lyngbya aestuarii]|uniref:hypothetical protein n=1 Tax=Lyngbya aestuarii TaxID=118322 RepID=UPI00403E17BC
MEQQTQDPAVAYAVAMLSHYGFELRGYPAQELVDLWLERYQASWVRLGVIEALYQGRYKAVSVEQILAVWSRRGQPIYRFNHEFERIISRKLPQSLTTPLKSASKKLSQNYYLPPVNSSFSDTPDHTDQAVIFETGELEEASTTSQTIATASIMPSEELTSTPVNSPEQLPEKGEDTSLRETYKTDWSRCETSKQPIDQFIPPPDTSGFCLKLKSVVEQVEQKE